MTARLSQRFGALLLIFVRHRVLKGIFRDRLLKDACGGTMQKEKELNIFIRSYENVELCYSHTM
jgi:hypothetical protein